MADRLKPGHQSKKIAAAWSELKFCQWSFPTPNPQCIFDYAFIQTGCLYLFSGMKQIVIVYVTGFLLRFLLCQFQCFFFFFRKITFAVNKSLPVTLSNLKININRVTVEHTQDNFPRIYKLFYQNDNSRVIVCQEKANGIISLLLTCSKDKVHLKEADVLKTALHKQRWKVTATFPEG